MTGTFGAVANLGTLEFDDLKRFADHVKSLQGFRVTVIVKRERRGRTLSQNAFLWAGVYGEIVAQRFYDRDDVSAEDVHQFCKEKFCPVTEVPMVGEEVLKKRSTRLLTVEQKSEYIERIMAYFAEYGVEFGQ